LNLPGLACGPDPWHDEDMPKRTSRKPKYPESDDPNVLAHRMVEIITEAHAKPTEPSLVSQVMAEMGRKGGRIGGKRRMETMTPEERSQAALAAAKARWAKPRKSSPKQ